MSKMSDNALILGTYFLSAFNIVWDFDLIKSVIIFITTMILLVIQIKLHYKRLKNDEKNNPEEGKKN